MIVSTTSHFPRQKQECHSSEDSNLYNRGEKSNQYQILSQQAMQKVYSVGITQCLYLVKIYVLPFQAPKKFAFLSSGLGASTSRFCMSVCRLVKKNVKNCQKLSKNCQKKLSKKLSKNCQKMSKSVKTCQKKVKNVKKNIKIRKTVKKV